MQLHILKNVDNTVKDTLSCILKVFKKDEEHETSWENFEMARSKKVTVEEPVFKLQDITSGKV